MRCRAQNLESQLQGGGGDPYGDFSVGENSARGKFRTCQIMSALEAKGNLGLRSPKDTQHNKATRNDSIDVVDRPKAIVEKFRKIAEICEKLREIVRLQRIAK